MKEINTKKLIGLRPHYSTIQDLRRAESARDSYKEQRDELLAALREVVREFCPSKDKMTRKAQLAAFLKGVSAISRAEGRQP